MGVLQSRSITDRGRILLADVQAGAVFIPTKIVIGSGNIPAGSTATTLTDVVAPVIELGVSKHKKSADGKVTFGGVYTNENITSDFYFRELALYARAEYRDAEGNVTRSVPECLYTYGHFGDTADLMPAYSSSTVVERNIDLVTWVGNETQIELTVESGVYLPREEFDNHSSRHATGGEDEITPEDIGALSILGGKVNGIVEVDSFRQSSDKYDIPVEIGTLLDFHIDGSTKDFDGRLHLSQDGSLRYSKEAGDDHEVIHSGNAAEHLLAKIVTGTYVGTGTYGQDNPTVLNAPFDIKIAIITPEGANSYAGPDSWQPPLVLVKGTTQGVYMRNNQNNEIEAIRLSVTWDGERVSFYNTIDEVRQLNRGIIYNYVLLG